MTKLQEFQIKLRDLLDEYDAYIWVYLNGDTHGVSTDIELSVQYEVDGLEITDAQIYRDICGLESSDIKIGDK